MTVTGRAEGPSHERDRLGAVGPGTVSGPVFASSLLAAARELRAATFEIDAERLPDLVKAGGHLERHSVGQDRADHSRLRPGAAPPPARGLGHTGPHVARERSPICHPH